jgi:hypothetical protein
MDPSSVLNLILSAFIAFAFGTLSAWITYRYQRKRDDSLWEHEKEKLRDEINQDLRKQREMVVRSEILPTIWRNLLDALGTLRVITSFYREYPDLGHIGDDALTEFLKNSRLSEAQQRELLQAPDRNAFYQKTIFWYQYDDAQRKFNEFHNHLLYNKIYVNLSLFEKLSEMDNSLSQLLNQSKLAHQYQPVYNEKLYEDIKKFNERTDTLLGEIEKEIQQSLHS